MSRCLVTLPLLVFLLLAAAVPHSDAQGALIKNSNRWWRSSASPINATTQFTPATSTSTPWNLAGQVGVSNSEVAAVLASARQVASGGWHTCALTSAGGVKCWGNNDYGQLGDGTTTSRSTPVDVSGLTAGVAAVTTGAVHTCALTNAGAVKCWGENQWGKLGDGTTSNRSTPVNVSGLSSGVAAVFAGAGHTCAMTAEGGAKCWGRNDYGQLGDGTASDRYTPVGVRGLASGVTAVSAGWWHTCAVTSEGADAFGLKCWGANDEGQLGDGTMTNRFAPVYVSGLTRGVATVTAGLSHTCALTNRGASSFGVECWGRNDYGQVGDGTRIDRTTPVDVNGMWSGAAAVAAGGFHTCALTRDASGVYGAKCWGSNQDGQLGDGTTTGQYWPVDVSGLNSGVVAIATGGEQTCALTGAAAHGVKCWGRNDLGQVGDGTTTDRTSPVDVVGFEETPLLNPLHLPLVSLGR